MFHRATVHLDLDSFFVSVERLKRSDLQGKPVIIGGLSDRAVVASCSYEARYFGVHSAMPMKQALSLCPHAVVIRGDMDEYSRYSRMVTEIIAAQAPLYEKASIDEHYLDLSGMDRFFGCQRWTQSLRQRIIKETGLPISYGLSVNKTIAKIATKEGKPNGEKVVEEPEVPFFLRPLSIRKIPGLGQKTFETFRLMGIVNIGQLAAIPKEYMMRILGKNGLMLWEKANGIDNSPILPYTEQKSISKEHTFLQDTIDYAMLNNLLVHMASHLGYELRRQGKLAGTLSVKIRYANFDTHTKDCSISYTSSDHVLIETAKEIFKKAYARRMLIRLIGLKVSGLVSGYQQMTLFEDSEHLMHLYQAMDVLKNKYGHDAVFRATDFTFRRAERNNADQSQAAASLPRTKKLSYRSFYGHRTDKEK